MKEIIGNNIDKLIEIEKDYPNDVDFGRISRSIINNTVLNRKHPNDLSLGKILRIFLKKNSK